MKDGIRSAATQDNGAFDPRNVSKISEPVCEHDPGLVVQEAMVSTSDVAWSRQDPMAIPFEIFKVKGIDVADCEETK